MLLQGRARSYRSGKLRSEERTFCTFGLQGRRSLPHPLVFQAPPVRSLGLRPRIPEPLEAILDPERRRVWVEEKHAVVYTLFPPSGAFALDEAKRAVQPPRRNDLCDIEDLQDLLDARSS